MADSDADGTLLSKILLAEYEQLKKEQVSRIRVRDSLPAATLTAAAAVGAAILNTQTPVGMLLLLPPVVVVLGWTYLVNDRAVSALGEYLRCDLGPQLSSLAGGVPVLGWETARLGDPRRRLRKRFQLAVDLVAFGVLPFLSLLVVWVVGPVTVLLALVSVVEAVAVFVLSWQIVLYADEVDVLGLVIGMVVLFGTVVALAVSMVRRWVSGDG